MIALFFRMNITNIIFPEFTLSDRFSDMLWCLMDLNHCRLLKICLIKTYNTVIIAFQIQRLSKIGLSKVHDIH